VTDVKNDNVKKAKHILVTSLSHWHPFNVGCYLSIVFCIVADYMSSVELCLLTSWIAHSHSSLKWLTLNWMAL